MDRPPLVAKRARSAVRPPACPLNMSFSLTPQSSLGDGLEGKKSHICMAVRIAMPRILSPRESRPICDAGGTYLCVFSAKKKQCDPCTESTTGDIRVMSSGFLDEYVVAWGYGIWHTCLAVERCDRHLHGLANISCTCFEHWFLMYLGVTS